MAGAYPDFLDPIETYSRDQLDRHQEAALADMSAHAFAHAPLVTEVWSKAGVDPSAIKSTADFQEKVPFLDKDLVRAFRDAHNDPAGGMGHAIPGQTVSIGTTSGTTGDPTPIPNWRRTPSDWGYSRDHWHIGMRPGDYIVHMLFTFRGGHRRRGMSELGVAEICHSMSPGELPRLCEGAKRYRPTTMSIIANPLILGLEQYFEKSGDDPTDVFKSFKGALFGGEPLGDRLRALTKSWGLELFETTSLGDVCGATECSARDGFHAYEDLAFIEAIDPETREPVADGEIGELVVTTLVDRLTPLVRYRTGDLAIINRSPCGCGRNHARFKVLGRATDQIIVEGRSILPREIMGLIENESETRAGLFQIIRTGREMDALRLRIGYEADRLTGPADALHGRLTDIIKAAIEVPLHIELVDQEELLKLGPPHKIPRVTKA